MSGYEGFQNTGIKWMASIPSHWNIKRLKSIFQIRKEKNDPVITKNILSLTAKQGVVPYAEKEDKGGNKPKENLTDYFIAHEGDLLVNCMNVVSGAAGVSKYFGAVSPVYYPLYPRKDDNVWYYHHVFRLITFQRSLVGLGKGIMMHESENGTLTTVRKRISMDSLGNVLLPIPPRDEQDQIVRYLDWKVSEINQLINMKKKEIRTVEAIQRSVITELVTHGLSPTAPMKYSGNKWLGNIPAHWNVVPLYAVAKEKSIVGNVDLDLLSVYLEEGVVPFSSRSEKRTNATSTDLSKYQRVDVGDFVLNNQQAWRGSVGVSEYIGIVSPAYIVLSMDTTLCRPYANYLLRSRALINQYVIISKGVGSIQRNIYWSALKRVSILVPPMEEQIMISEHIKSVISQYETVTKKLMKGIEALEEYKTRLVSDVVTGRVDVRGVVIPNYKRTEEIIDDETDVESDDEIADDKED